MPDPAWYPTIAAFTNYLGGAQSLRQLADPLKTGQADTAIVQGYISSGIARALGKASIKHDAETLANLDAASTLNLTDIALGQAARFAYERGGQGQVMPPRLEAAVARSDADLADLVEGRLRLSRVAGQPAAALSESCGVMDYDSLGTGISITGFRRGFR